jgi:hypothetical protein
LAGGNSDCSYCDPEATPNEVYVRATGITDTCGAATAVKIPGSGNMYILYNIYSDGVAGLFNYHLFTCYNKGMIIPNFCVWQSDPVDVSGSGAYLGVFSHGIYQDGYFPEFQGCTSGFVSKHAPVCSIECMVFRIYNEISYRFNIYTEGSCLPCGEHGSEAGIYGIGLIYGYVQTGKCVCPDEATLEGTGPQGIWNKTDSEYDCLVDITGSHRVIDTRYASINVSTSTAEEC